MADVTRVDPDGVRQVSSQLNAAASTFGALARELSAKVDSTRDCWGDDEFSRKLKENLEPSTSEMLESSESVLKNVADTAASLSDAAKALVQQDEAGAGGKR